MKKRQFFALLCSLFLLLFSVACKKEEQPSATPPAGGGENSPPQSEEDNGAGGSFPFAVRFEKDGVGFDTEAGTLFTKDAVTSRDFSQDLAYLKERLGECNAYEIRKEHPDLTYKTLSGGKTPTGENPVYVIRITADEETHTITIDEAAITAYKDSNSHVSNIGALVHGLAYQTAYWNGELS